MLELTMTAPSSCQILTILFYQLNHFPNFLAEPLAPLHPLILPKRDRANTLDKISNLYI